MVSTLTSDLVAPGLIPSIPQKNQKKNCWCWWGQSIALLRGNWVADNVDQTHLVPSSGKRVLQKSFITREVSDLLFLGVRLALLWQSSISTYCLTKLFARTQYFMTRWHNVTMLFLLKNDTQISDSKKSYLSLHLSFSDLTESAVSGSLIC